MPPHATHPRPWRPPRLLLEPWQERRIEDFINLTGDERVMRYIGPGRVWTRAEAIDRFHAAADHWRTQAFGWRSVVDKVTREWIGLIALNRLGPGIRGVDEDEIEVGWWLVPTAWRRGIATEGARAACAEAFMCVGVTPAVPRCRPANQRSLAVMERIGIRRGSRPSGATAKSSASTPWIVPRGSAPPAPGHRREHRLRRPAVDGRGSLRRLRGQCTVEPCRQRPADAAGDARGSRGTAVARGRHARCRAGFGSRPQPAGALLQRASPVCRPDRAAHRPVKQRRKPPAERGNQAASLSGKQGRGRPPSCIGFTNLERT